MRHKVTVVSHFHNNTDRISFLCFQLLMFVSEELTCGFSFARQLEG